MSDRRQELYDRIRESSKEEFILDEMIRLGFWPRQGVMPEDPADEIRRMGELQKEFNTLRTEFSRLNDEAALRKALRKKRMEESRQRQKENKEKRIQLKAEKARLWQERKAREILYLGQEVSAGLNQHEAKPERLSFARLPEIKDASQLAALMNISIGQLRFLAFQRRVSQTSHYKRFMIPKKMGGERLISAPMPRLKKNQRWILDEILAKVAVTPQAHGFYQGRSIVSNAREHAGAKTLINIDLKDFFPTLTYKRIKGLFRALGYGESVATILALLCTEPTLTELELDGRRYFVAEGERHLPQGAPTSPALTNIICRKMDRRLVKGAERHGFKYTRYADDLSFSSPVKHAPDIGAMIGLVHHIVQDSGFRVHPDKVRVLHSGRRLEVTGLTVNDGVGVDRRTLRRFRALIHQVRRDGPVGKSWGASANLFASMQGFACFVHMVSPEKGRLFMQAVQELKQQHNT